MSGLDGYTVRYLLRWFLWERHRQEAVLHARLEIFELRTTQYQTRKLQLIVGIPSFQEGLSPPVKTFHVEVRERYTFPPDVR